MSRVFFFQIAPFQAAIEGSRKAAPFAISDPMSALQSARLCELLPASAALKGISPRWRTQHSWLSFALLMWELNV
jgi:hypothetical protein